MCTTRAGRISYYPYCAGEWSPVGDAYDPNRPTPRDGHTLTSMGHRITLFGGRGTDRDPLSDVHILT
jgi:hypothetical protein